MSLKRQYTETEVCAIDDLFTAAELLSDNDIEYDGLETVEELRMLLLNVLKEGKQPPQDNAEASSSGQQDNLCMKELFEHDQKRRDDLSKIYLDVMSFLDSRNLETSVTEQIERYYPRYMSRMSAYNHELIHEDCPIVVAGETSAGKSSILNLLLGEDVLPSSVLCATAIICRIQHSDDKKLTVLSKYKGDPDVQRMDIHLDKSCDGAKLKELMGKYAGRDSIKANEQREIRISWPISILQGNISIVDTPGIGENPELTEVLFNFLPKAAAFIYVINSANAGGVQQDRILSLLDKQACQKTEETKQLHFFNPKSAIFVCNKWDQVPDAEEDEVMRKTFNTLQRCWPGLSRCQLIKMSATEAARCLSSGAGKTTKFRNLCTGIENLIPVSLDVKSQTHFEWLWTFVKTIQKTIFMRLTHAKQSHKEKKEKEKRLRDRLLLLQEEADFIMSSLKSLLDKKCCEIVDQIYDHMQSEEVTSRLMTWDEAEVPVGDDLEIVSYLAEKKIHARITEELNMWCEKTAIFSHTLEDIVKYFKIKFRLLDDEFQKWDQELQIGGTGNSTLESVPLIKMEREGVVFSTAERLVLGLTSPLWVPLALVATIVALPILGSLALKETVRQKAKLSRYKANKTLFMAEWAFRAIEGLDTESIRNCIVEKQFECLRESVQVLENVIPRQLEADRNLIDDVLNDMRSSSSILEQYTPLQKKCKRLISKLRLVRLKYFDTDRIPDENVRIYEKIGGGTFAEVFAGELIRDDGTIVEVAVKVMKSTGINDLGALQLSEVDILRSLQHKNIVDMYGVVFTERPQTSLKLLMELCKCTLKEAIFGNESRIPSCHQNRTRGRERAFAYFRSSALQILEALEYTHEKGYVHRDIKLGNVLVSRSELIKLTDVGLTACEDDITGTLCGTWSHVAPEVIRIMRFVHQTPEIPVSHGQEIVNQIPDINILIIIITGQIYSKPADMYSLGIVFWEMWYGKGAFKDDDLANLDHLSPPQLLWCVVEGLRPSFQNRYAPGEDLKQLLQNCWSDEHAIRPTAKQCADIIRSIKS